MPVTQQRTIFREDHDQFRETVRRFFKRECEPNLRAWEKDGRFPAEVFKKAGEYGILQAGIPTEYGGMGGDFLHHAILHEEAGFSIAGASMGGGLGIDGSGYIILGGGTEEQKKEWLPRYASGETIAACFTEPQSGSDVQGFRTHARKDGDDYIVNGHKIWITNGSICTLFPLICRTSDAKGSGAFSILLVDANAPGVHVTKGIETLHRGCANEAEVFFEDVRVPKERLVGGVEGMGFKQVMGTLNEMRIAEGARFLAAAELAFDLTVEFTRNRTAFGTKVIDFQNSQFKLADIKAQIMVARAFVDQCLAKAQNMDGQLTPIESSVAKLTCSELEFNAADQCLQLHGGWATHTNRRSRRSGRRRASIASCSALRKFTGLRLGGAFSSVADEPAAAATAQAACNPQFERQRTASTRVPSVNSVAPVFPIT